MKLKQFNKSCNPGTFPLDIELWCKMYLWIELFVHVGQ